ncbi:hypothetical protein [Burkholderia multivorans]|uniref:hypothetical protein n=1 Tax=Burkholderia multivorans TaxID=87883 RepID=UPI001590DCFC|nr:hypothetical protein [Burkholderia multivorans]MCA8339869.1 hypothetical protein [Burkholderia multivorans]
MSHTHDILRRLLHILESGRALNGISNDRATVYAGALREILESPQPAQADARVGLTDEQREAIKYAIIRMDLNVRNRDANTAAKELRALLNAANHAE